MPREMKRKYLELNKITTYKNLWDAAMIMLRGKLVILNACMRKEKGLKLII